MGSLVVAVWILTGVVTGGAVFILLFIIKMRKSIENTLQETQNLLKKVEGQVDSIGENFGTTAENAKDATLHLRNALKNTEKTTAFINQIAPFASILLLLQGFNTRTDSKSRSLLNNIMNIGKIFVAIQQGFSLYRKISSTKKGGLPNYGRKQNKRIS